MELDPKLLTLKKQQRNAFYTNVQKEILKLKTDLLVDIIDPVAVQSSISKLNQYQSKIEELNEYIQYFAEESKLETDIAKFLEICDSITDATTLATSKIQSAQKTKHESKNGGGPGSSKQKCHTVKLPKLELAKFHGDPMLWDEFWDSFSTTIHENSDLSDIDKFKYLKSYLEGEALSVVEGYRLTSVNYNEAVGTLRERYGNPQAVIFAHFDSLLSLPTASHDVSELQKTFDSCEAHIRSLVALGLNEDTFGQVFTPIIISKLPKFVRMDLYRQNGCKPWLLSELRALLAAEIRVRQMSLQSVGNHGDNRDEKHSVKNEQFKKPKWHGQGTTSALVTGANRSPGRSHFPVTEKGRRTTACVFCGENHWHDECQRYPDALVRQSRVMGNCFSCLRPGHSVRDCKTARKCFYCGKSGHHRSLCYVQFPGKSPKPGKQEAQCNSTSGANPNAHPFVPANETLSHCESTYLSTGLVDVADHSAGRVVQGRCFLDSGGSRTFITADLCNRLGAKKTGREVLSIAGFRDTTRKSASYDTVELNLLFVDGSKLVIHANVVPEITCPVQILPIDVQQFPFVRDLHLAEPLVQSPQMVPIDILIGNDYYYDIVGSSHVVLQNGPRLISSKLGFIVAGRVNSDSVRGSNDGSVMLQTTLSPTFDIERFWSLEDIGVKDKNDLPEDEVAMESFNKTVRFQDGRYEVTWPWREDQPDLPDNYPLANGRLKSLCRRISSNPEVMTQYSETIRNQEKLGIIEKAPPHPDGSLVHYIPHHCVLTPSKATTKLRIVYDASAKASRTSPSLNEMLYRGPVMLADLCGLILRFRMCAIAIVSDIEKAFLQVGLQPQERDVTRFLWLKDVSKPPVGDNVVAYRFCRVPFGFIASSFLLVATVLHHLKAADTPVARRISSNLYVDNVIAGESNIADAVAFYREAKSLLASAGMNLREWYTNSSELAEEIAPEDQGKSGCPKVLGLQWNTKADTLRCEVGVTDPGSARTKRQILQSIARIFDPCGFFAPVTITGKMLMQELWVKQCEWDDVLDDEFLQKWEVFNKEFALISSCEIPRCLFNDGASQPVTHQLHCFCDASMSAYAAVVYLRSTSASGVEVNLMFAKSRVGPVKKLTIPRMELMAAVVGVRLLKFVETELRQGSLPKKLWSDSKCVLSWISTKKVSTVFVENRVREIRSHSDVDVGYVRTDFNPADIPTRGCDLGILKSSKLWWHGPDFLSQSEELWPKDEFKMMQEDVTDVGGSSVDTVQVVVPNKQVAMFDMERCSTLNKLVRVTAWVQRFVNNVRRKTVCTGPLSATELGAAKRYWLKHHQRNHFSSVVAGGKEKTTVRLTQQLGLTLDKDGLVRSGGRLSLSDLDDDAKSLVLLAPNDHLTTLVIEDQHRQLYHAGVSHTLSAVRRSYWIVRGRQQVKKVIGRCVPCKRIVGSTYPLPRPPPLPSFRVTESVPFKYTGIDYIGPLFVRQPAGPDQKVWICLFTCAVIRAVHLEVVGDLSSQQFLLSLRRFAAVRGVPSMIISDNASQFKLAQKALTKLCNEVCQSDSTQDFSSVRGISWKFLPEMSPWMGGFYERLVAGVKLALKKSLWNRCLSMAELCTVIYEISVVLNSRPLTYVGDEHCTPLTPAHFLLGNASTTLPQPDVQSDPDFQPTVLSSASLVMAWKRLGTVVKQFWQIWRDQYLQSLRGRYSKGYKSDGDRPMIGSVVLIKDNLTSNKWRLGKIVKLNVGADDVCRSVQLRVAGGKILVRPVKLLVPLEQSDCNSDGLKSTDSNHNIDSDSNETAQSTSAQEQRNRPRSAKRMANERLAAMIRQLNDTETD